MTPRHIGIVACSAEGAALCYRTICVEGAAILGPHGHPEVTVHTYPLANYMACIHRDDWSSVGELMLCLRQQAESGWRGFPDLPRQHHPSGAAIRRSALAAPLVAHRRGGRERSGGARLQTPGDHRHALAGRQRCLSERVEGAGVGLHAANAGKARRINRIIMDELVCGVFKAEAVAYLQCVYARMKTDGCDAVVLGCTEIPLIMNDPDSPLPTLDSTRLLARAALRRAVVLQRGSD